MVRPRFLAFLAAATILIAAALTLSTAVARELIQPGLNANTREPSQIAALHYQAALNRPAARLSTAAIPAAVRVVHRGSDDSLLLPLALAGMLLLAGGIAYRTVTIMNYEC